jgi:hypothetical protein
MLLYLTTTFSFSQVHHQIYQNVKCQNRFGYIDILREIIENNYPFPPEFGRPKASTFRSRGVPGRLDALLAKSLMRVHILRTMITHLLVHMHQKKKIALGIAAKIASVNRP